MKTPIVFSLVREQSIFMTTIMSLLTFLSVLALGIALSIGTGVMRWNNQWELYATVQVTNPDNLKHTQKTIDDNKTKIAHVEKISNDQMKQLMAPWISGGNALENYLPTMWEIRFNSKSDLKSMEPEFSKHARFLTHATALKQSTSAGWKMIIIASLMLGLTLGAIGICISYIAQNTALLHRRELEILNQIGAHDNFVARQMQIIVAKISSVAATGGFVAAALMLLLILSTARSARVGLMAMMGLNGWGWFILILLPISIVTFAIFITKRTTLKILNNN